MVKFPEADMRKFRGMFVCKRCKTRRKASSIKITQGKISCRKCNGKAFRSVRKK